MERERMDYQQCRRVWQRVAPELEPYPEGPEAAVCPADWRLQRLEELIGEELAERRAYLAAARCAPAAAARRCMQQLGREEGGHARRLAALYFLLSGQCFRPNSVAGPEKTCPWRTLLRESWKRENWAAGQYAQLARDCADPGLRQLLEELGRDEERHARLLLRLLEQNILAF